MESACRALSRSYEQLGLKFRLYSAEILFNRGLALINIGGSSSTSAGMQLLDSARREKQTPEHGVIDEAFATHGRDFTVFSVPVGVGASRLTLILPLAKPPVGSLCSSQPHCILQSSVSSPPAVFRPPAIKLRNLKAKNYLGTAKLVAATELADAFIGFSGTGVAPSKQASPSQSQSSTSSFKIGTGAEAAGGRAPALLTSTRMRSNSLSGDALASRPSKPPSPPPNVPLPAIPSGLAGLMNANISVVASDPRDTRDTSTIRPLRIQKSSPDLRAARGQAQHQQLPKLNTNVGAGVGQLYIQRDAAGARIAGAGGVYSTAPLAERTYAPSRNGSRTVGGSGNGDGNGNGTYIANAMMAPPSPPESDYGEPLALHNRSHSRDSPVYPKSGVASQQQQKQGSRRTSSDTTLIYRTSDARQQAQAQAYVQASAQGQDQDRGQGQSRGYARSKGPRETEFMEELIGGYSAVSPLPRDMLSPDNTVTASAVALTGPEPMPQGQSRDRVANWASTQAHTPVQSQREHDREQSRLNVNVHTNTSGGGLVRHGTGSSAQSSATGVVGVPGTRGANRRRAQTDGPAAQFLTSRYGDSAFDDALSALTVDMVSFRLKLHFEDDVRGMVRCYHSLPFCRFRGVSR